MNVQLANAISDLSGTTGLAIIRAILAGERDPRELAKLRDPRVQAREEEIAHSLEGNWREDVRFELQQAVDPYDFLPRQVAACDLQLQKYMAALPSREAEGAPRVAPTPVAVEAGVRPRKAKTKKRSPNAPTFDLAAELRRAIGVDWLTIEGIHVMTAQTILAELGPDRSVFPTQSNFTSGLGLLPWRDISGGKVMAQRMPPGQASGRQRLMPGGGSSRSQRLLPGSPVSPFEGPIGRTESGQSHGSLSGLFSVPVAHQRTGVG